MANGRKKGLILTGAFYEEEKVAKLDLIATEGGYPDRSAFLKALYDQHIAANRPLLERLLRERQKRSAKVNR